MHLLFLVLNIGCEVFHTLFADDLDGDICLYNEIKSLIEKYHEGIGRIKPVEKHQNTA